MGWLDRASARVQAKTAAQRGSAAQALADLVASGRYDEVARTVRSRDVVRATDARRALCEVDDPAVVPVLAALRPHLDLGARFGVDQRLVELGGGSSPAVAAALDAALTAHLVAPGAPGHDGFAEVLAQALAGSAPGQAVLRARAGREAVDIRLRCGVCDVPVPVLVAVPPWWPVGEPGGATSASPAAWLWRADHDPPRYRTERLAPPGLLEVVDRHDLAALASVDRVRLPFLCPECPAAYCSDHHGVTTTSVPADLPAADGTEVTTVIRCGRGHVHRTVHLDVR